jgi:hypothetical protein
LQVSTGFSGFRDDPDEKLKIHPPHGWRSPATGFTKSEISSDMNLYQRSDYGLDAGF